MRPDEYIWIVTINDYPGRLITKLVTVAKLYSGAIIKGTERFREIHPKSHIADIRAKRCDSDTVYIPKY